MTAQPGPGGATATRSAARVAAISGIVFAGLFVAALVLVHRAPTLGDPDAAYAAFYANGGDQLFVAVGLYLVPFAGSGSTSATRPPRTRQRRGRSRRSATAWCSSSRSAGPACSR